MAKKETAKKTAEETKETENSQSPAQETTALAVTEETKPDLYSADFVKEVTKHKNNIKIEFGKMDKSIFRIAFNLHWLHDNNGYVPLGYDNIYDLAKAEFDIARGTTSNYINMVDRFGERDELDNFTGKIIEKYLVYSSSKLIAMHDLLDSEIDGLLKPDMSVRDIKSIVNKIFGKQKKLTGNTPDPIKGNEKKSDPVTGKDGILKDQPGTGQGSGKGNSPAPDIGTDIPPNGTEDKGKSDHPAIQVGNKYYKVLHSEFSSSFLESENWKERLFEVIEKNFNSFPYSRIVIGVVENDSHRK